jgi:hypothetical protein
MLSNGWRMRAHAPPTQPSCPATPGGQYWATLNLTCGYSAGAALLQPSFYQVKRGAEMPVSRASVVRPSTNEGRPQTLL